MRTTAEKGEGRGRGDTLPMMEGKRKKGRKKKKMEDTREKAEVELTRGLRRIYGRAMRQ